MINHQGVLDAVTNMQQNAQAALPVIPNNGNPQGANNMQAAGQQAQPAVQGAPVQPQKSDYYYPWLAPSPHMQALASRIGSYQPQIAPARPVPQQPLAPGPVLPYFKEPLR